MSERKPEFYAVEIKRRGEWTWQCQQDGRPTWAKHQAEAEVEAWRQDGYEARVVPLFRYPVPPDAGFDKVEEAIKALRHRCYENATKPDEDGNEEEAEDEAETVLHNAIYDYALASRATPASAVAPHTEAES